MCGFLVDEVADIVPVHESAIQPPPSIEMAERGVVSGLVQIGAGVRDTATEGRDGATMIALLDLDALKITAQLDLVEATAA